MGLTKQQQYAVDNIKSWFRDSITRSYTLEGAAGCGKSFTISHLLRELGGKKVALSPTNKAKQVLEEFIASTDGNVPVMTIHSALGYKVNDSTNSYKVKGRRVIAEGSTSTEATGNYKIDPEVELIIVDEASMVDVLLERELLNLAKSIDAKILWVGDGYQLKLEGNLRRPA